MKCLGERANEIGLAVLAAGEDGGVLASSLAATERNSGGHRR